MEESSELAVDAIGGIALSLIAERLSDVVWVVDADGVCRWASPSLRRVLGYEPDDVVGGPLVVVHPDDRGSVQVNLGTAGATQSTDHQRVRVITRDGLTLWVDTWTVPWPGGGGDASRWSVTLMRDVGREVAAERTYREARERLTAVLESTLEPHVQMAAVRDDAGAIVDFIFNEANEAACGNLGRDREELLGARTGEVLAGDHYCDVLASYARVVDTGEALTLEAVQYDDDPAARRYDVRAVKVADGVSLTWRDVTERYETAQALAAREQDFQLLAESIGDVVLVLGVNGIQTWVSPSVTTLLGYIPEELVGTYAQALIHPEDFDRALASAVEVGLARGTVTPPRRTRVRHADGHWVWTETTNSFAYDADGQITQIIVAVRDAEAQVQAEAELQHMATTDALTGLLNRACILDRLEMIAANAPGDGATAAVLFCDLDGLKTVNDTLGHAAGDAMITTAARRAAGQLRANDLIARFGGDELLVVLPRVRDLDDAVGIAEGLRKALAEPVPMPDSDREVQGSVSVGVAVLRPGESADHVISRADKAMYEAKSTGRNKVVTAE